VLVSVLLRLAKASADGQVLIGGFEEPEEALEPLRQAQFADTLVDISKQRGQVFVVTHSPEIARRFEIDDFLLLGERTAGRDALALRTALSAPVRQTYERWLDGAVVRGLFAKIPVLVEGPGDRAVFDVFWRQLVTEERVRPAAELGVEVVNCEGAPNLPMHAAVLDEAGKAVVAWAERDTEEVRDTLDRMRSESHCSAIILHDATEGRQNLEGALAGAASLEALADGLSAMASDRGYDWEAQRTDLVSRSGDLGVDSARLDQVKAAGSFAEVFGALGDETARRLIAHALSSKSVTPFEMKGGRQARIFAAAIVEKDGVPEPFAKALEALRDWIDGGHQGQAEIEMGGG